MKQLNFAIIDGYPKASRDHFEEVGMTKAGELYAKLLLHCIKKYNLKKILIASNTHASSRKLYDKFSEIFKFDNL